MNIGNDVGYSSHQAMFRGDPLRFILLVVLIPVFGVGALGLVVWYVVAKSVYLEIDPTGRITFTKDPMRNNRFNFAVCPKSKSRAD